MPAKSMFAWTMTGCITKDDDESRAAEQALDEEELDYDYDSGNRMMIGQDGLEFLSEKCFDYWEV